MRSERVTLESPDGRRYTTDDPAEVVSLTSGHGYRRVRDSEPQPYEPVGWVDGGDDDPHASDDDPLPYLDDDTTDDE